MKHFIMLLALAVVGTVGAQDRPNYVPADGLMGWFAMDGNALDLSDNQNNGTIDGATSSTNRLGVSDAALEFGDSTNNDLSRVSIPGLVTDVYDSFSVTFWGNPSQSVVFPNQGQTGNEIPPNGQIALHAIHGHFFGPDDEHAGFGVALATNGISMIEHSDAWHTAPVVVEQDLSDWHHYSIVYSNGLPTLFIDGVGVAAGIGAERTIHISFGTDPWYLLGGIGHGYEARRFHGKLDDMGFWNRSLSDLEVSELYLEQVLIPGCTDETACNYETGATFEDESCIYPPMGVSDCEIGGEFCGDGTLWNASIQECVGFNECPNDVDGDGIIGVNDLMQLLSMFGTDCPVWVCGESISYQGYNYETVQIGGQCWFAENLRATEYSNGDMIVGGLSDSAWMATTLGAQAIFGEGNNPCVQNAPDFDACDEAFSLAAYGRLYNWYSITDERNVCPNGWSVASHEAWNVLEDFAASQGFDGTAGIALKSNSGWNNGLNGSDDFGFAAQPGGQRTAAGFHYAGDFNRTWSPDVNNSFQYRDFWDNNGAINVYSAFSNEGLSVRCIHD